MPEHIAKLTEAEKTFILNFGQESPDVIGVFWRGVGRSGRSNSEVYDEYGVPRQEKRGLTSGRVFGRENVSVFTQVFRDGRHFYVDEEGREVGNPLR